MIKIESIPLDTLKIQQMNMVIKTSRDQGKLCGQWDKSFEICNFVDLLGDKYYLH